MSDRVFAAIVRLLDFLSEARGNFLGAVRDLLEKLSGADGQLWFHQLVRFLCKKPCWIPDYLEVPVMSDGELIRALGFAGDWAVVAYNVNSDRCPTEVDLSQVRLENAIAPCEGYITSTERQSRLMEIRRVCLDPGVLLALLKDPHRIPESWEKVAEQGMPICFERRIFRNPDVRHFVPALIRYRDGWSKTTVCVNSDRLTNHLSAVL